MIRWLFWVVVAYLLGSIPWGLVVARLYGGPDPRRAGSGNIGAANVYRLLGRNAGAFTLFGDFMKGAVPVFLARTSAPGWGSWHEAAVAGVALAAVAGHIWPLYLGFKGGKAVATSAGVLLAISPLATLLLIGLYGLLFWRWRTSSLASVLTAWAAPLAVGLLGSSKTYLLLSGILSGLILWRHVENIHRWAKGEEPELIAGRNTGEAPGLKPGTGQ